MFEIGIPKLVYGLCVEKGLEVNWAAWMLRGAQVALYKTCRRKRPSEQAVV